VRAVFIAARVLLSEGAGYKTLSAASMAFRFAGIASPILAPASRCYTRIASAEVAELADAQDLGFQGRFLSATPPDADDPFDSEL
jgi:hypothetical protein